MFGMIQLVLNQGFIFSDVNDDGCELKQIIDLTIINTDTSTEFVSTCDSYVWNNEVYFESGEYVYSTNNIFGCDSIATLILTISPSATDLIDTISYVQCDSFTWVDGINYLIK